MGELRPDYRVRWNAPLSSTYRGYKLVTVPAPASGAIWLSAMGALRHFEPTGSGDVLDLHRLTEALRVGVHEVPFLTVSLRMVSARNLAIPNMSPVLTRLSDDGYRTGVRSSAQL